MSGSICLLDMSECGLLLEDEDSISEEVFETFGKKLYDVLSSSGFAYLSNHGISSKKIEAAEVVAEKFFALPLQEKNKLYVLSSKYGYDPIYGTKADLKNADYFEGLRMSGYAFHNDNVDWESVPVPDLESVSFELAESFRRLMFRLLRALASGMKLKDKEYFCKAHSLANKEGNSSLLKYMHYPPVADVVLPSGSIRIGKHTDFSSLTLLLQDSNGGLQAESESGVFVDVKPVPGTIVLNIGDTIQKWSAGRLKSTVHRVLLPDDHEKKKISRRSIIYFGKANDDALMEHLQFEDGVVSPDLDCNEEPETVLQYNLKKYRDYFGITS